MSVLILSLFNGILLFRQRTEQSVLYHVCPDAEGLGGTLNSAPVSYTHLTLPTN